MSRLVNIGIDASRNRSGGAKAHLIGVLSETDPSRYGIKEVHVWSYKELLDKLPERSWLIKHNPEALERSILHQVFWQSYMLERELNAMNCAIVLNTCGGTFSKFSPCVTMSRDMLPYEPGEIDRFGLSIARLRLIVLRFLQNKSFKFSDGVIFLTKHAADTIQLNCGKLENIALIPHGVGKNFDAACGKKLSTYAIDFQCIYISNASLYKHQWNVVKAIEILRNKGVDISLKLVGGGAGKAQKLLDDQINKSDPSGSYVKQLKYLPQDELPNHLAEADIFIFASSCENMPNTLIEAMSSKIPIACSNRGPMPEVLKDGGVYFDPENPSSIADALSTLISNKKLANNLAEKAYLLSQDYSWSRCAHETWSFLRENIE